MLSANQVVALTYKDPFPQDSYNDIISQSHRSEAKLLQGYVSRYKEKINTLFFSYNAEKSQIMKDADTILEKMSFSLKEIQDKNLSSENATEIMQSIVTDLKTLNSRMKVYLEQQKEIHEKEILRQKLQYIQVGTRISKILDSLINTLTQTLIKKETLSKKEKKIVQSLLNIRTENNKIKDFSSTNFWSKEEMKSYFQNIIQNIRNEILLIKKLSL